MRFVIADSYDEMSRNAADVIAACINDNDPCVLGLATGSTPIGTYECLVRDYEAGKVSFADVTTYNLDEYCGISPESPDSYHYFMDDHLFSHVNIDPAHTHVPDGDGADPAASCQAYERALEDAGWVDLQLLGLGNNGHIGFNEPAPDFSVTTHIVKLTESTIDANSRLFESAEDVPREAITMGIGTIMKARKIVVVANGSVKAPIVKEAFTGPVRPEVPASVLQLHPDVTVILDKEAAADLKL